MNDELVSKQLDLVLRKQVVTIEGKTPEEVDIRSFAKATLDPMTGIRKYFWKDKHIATMNINGEVKSEVLTA